MKYKLRPALSSVVTIIAGELLLGAVVALITIFIQVIPDPETGETLYRVGYANENAGLILLGIGLGLVLLSLLFFSQRDVYFCTIKEDGMFISLGWRRRNLSFETVTFMDVSPGRVRIFTRREKYELFSASAREIYDAVLPKVKFN